MGEIHYSRGANTHDVRPEQRAVADFDAFVIALDNDRAAQKADAAYVCGPLNSTGRRCAKGALPRRFLALDFDQIAAPRLPALREWLRQFSAVAWFTHSSTETAPRMRAFVELDRDIARDEGISLGRVLAQDVRETFGGEVALDECTCKAEQAAFVPPTSARLLRARGKPLDVSGHLARYVAPKAAPKPQLAPDAHGSLIDDLRDALRVLDADDRKTWIANGQRLKSLGDAGYRLWIEYSARSVKFDADDAARVWRGLDGSRTSPAAVLAAARAAGRRNPGRRDAPRKGKPEATPAHESESSDEAADFGNPVAAAGTIARRHFAGMEHRTLHYWQGEFHHWTGAYYERMPNADVREMLYRIGEAESQQAIRKRAVDDVEDALRAVVNLSNRVVPAMPAWLHPVNSDPPAREVIPCRNGLLAIRMRELLPTTPRYFAPYCLPLEYRADTPAPAVWLEFLKSLWPNDAESRDALQEWFGYLLTADTKQQKALMLVGPRRSGKGTIGRTLMQLLGEHNCASPTLASLGSQFGLQPLVGKTLALMSDARLGRQADIAAIAENLLRLTGEDAITVPRKFMTDYTARLLARVVVLTNEVPVFRDAASALPSRFVILTTTTSFYGREDTALEARLTTELLGILAWALEGLQRLTDRGHFTQPAAGLEQVRLMDDLASPIGTFVREHCIVGPGSEVPVSKLYQRWCGWCVEHGRDRPGTEQTFGRDIAAAVPGIGVRRPRFEGERVRMYLGIRLREPNDPIEDDDLEF